MTTPSELLRRVADMLVRLNSNPPRIGGGAHDSVACDAAALRRLADRLEEPTDEMRAAFIDSYGAIGKSTPSKCIIAVIAAASGEGT